MQRRQRWPDDDVPWTLDEVRRFVSAIERTRMATHGDGSPISGIGWGLYATWRKLRGYLEAGMNADEIHRLMVADSQTFRNAETKRLLRERDAILSRSSSQPSLLRRRPVEA